MQCGPIRRIACLRDFLFKTLGFPFQGGVGSGPIWMYVVALKKTQINLFMIKAIFWAQIFVEIDKKSNLIKPRHTH